MSIPTAQELFDTRVPKALLEHPDKAREVGAVFQFTITGESGGDWTVDLAADPPTCVAGDRGDAQCGIEVSADGFRAMLTDPEAGMQLYFAGELKLSGDPTLATRLGPFFESIRD